MSKVNHEKYQRAHERIADGRWTVYPDAGCIVGPRGQAFAARTNGGYIIATYTAERRSVWVMVHRMIWEYVNGPIPEGLEINHINGVKTDNRIANLELVTGPGNKQHAWDTGLRRRIRGEDAAGAKLTREQVVAIFDRSWTSEPAKKIAAAFGVSTSLVRAIHVGKTWPHVTQPLIAYRGLDPSQRRLVDMDRARGQRIGTAKLTDAQYADILRRAAAGEHATEIARQLPVTPSAVQSYIQRHGRQTHEMPPVRVD